MISAGRLNKKVTVERLVKTADGAGGFSEQWVAWKEAWAAVEPITSKELLRAKELQLTTTHRVIIRYIEGVDPEMRVNFRGRYLRIQGIVNPGETNERLEITCEEVKDKP